MKKPLILALTLFASLAAADTFTGSVGKGRLVTADGRTGSFDCEAMRRTRENGETKLSGRLRFEQQPNAFGPYVLIEGGVPAVVGVNDGVTVCEFSAHAILTTLVNGRRVRFGGTVYVRAADRRDGQTGKGEPDLFRVRFVGEKGLTFASEGPVKMGDLVVATRKK